MNEHQLKAEAYVRSQCPELMELSFGCEIAMNDELFMCVGLTPKGGAVTVRKAGVYDKSKSGAVVEQIEGKQVIIGHPIKLHHWFLSLAKIEDSFLEFEDNGPTISVRINFGDDHVSAWVTFEYATGAPKGETNYKAFNQIVGI